MLKNSFIITLFFFLNGILGFICQMLYGTFFGAGADMDMYYKLLSIPTIVTGTTPVLFASLLIPLCPVYESKGLLNEFVAKLSSKIFYCNLFGIALIGLISIVVIYVNDKSETETRVVINVLLWTSAFFAIMNGFYSSILNYKKKFVLLASLSSTTYVGIILSVLIFHDALGVSSIALGMLMASIICYFILRLFNKDNISHIHVDINYKEIGKKLLYIIITLIPFTAYAAIAYSWADKLPEGSVSYLGYSHSFEVFLSVAASMGIATVSFPDIAKQLISPEYSVRKTSLLSFVNVIKIVYLFLCGFVVFGCFFRIPIISILLEHGEFTSESVVNLSKVLPIYFICGSMIAILNLIRNVYYSLGQEKLLACISAVVTLIFYVSSQIVGTCVNYVGVGLFECVSLLCITIGSLYFINRQYHFIRRDFFVEVVKITFWITMVGACVWGTSFFYSNLDSIVLLLLSAVFYGVLLLVILIYILKVPEIILFIDKFKTNAVKLTKRNNNGVDV